MTNTFTLRIRVSEPPEPEAAAFLVCEHLKPEGQEKRTSNLAGRAWNDPGSLPNGGFNVQVRLCESCEGEYTDSAMNPEEYGNGKHPEPNLRVRDKETK